MKRLIARLRGEAVLAVSAACAAVSMLFVPPDAGYAAYIDVRVLCLLFCLMAVVAGLGRCGVFAVLAQKLLGGEKSLPLLSLLLVLLPFFCSMLVTNDVALITFVPFAVLVLGMIGRMEELARVVALQTVAANLGSMATPVGNPQNLFLYEFYAIPPAEFFARMLPLTLVSLAGLAAAALLAPRETIRVRFRSPASLREGRLLAVLCVLFALCLLCVLHVLHHLLLLAAVAGCLLIFARDLFKEVDYSLLLTFVCFFVFAGNIGRIGPVRQFLAGVLEGGALLPSLLLSQIVSNVPAAVLLSGFTADWRGLLAGVDIGGLGTPVASLASLISLRLYLRSAGARPARFFALFALYNLAGLAVLLAAQAFIFA